jgi:hypothetical protein
MSDGHDPLGESGAAFGAIARSGVVAVTAMTQAAATRRAERDRQAQQDADNQRRAIVERTHAEHHTASLAYGRVGSDAWWERATVHDVANAWQAASGWETRDARAGLAMDEIRSRVQDRPDLRDELAAEYGLHFDDSRIRLDRERQAAEVAAAGLASAPALDVAPSNDAERDDAQPKDARAEADRDSDERAGGGPEAGDVATDPNTGAVPATAPLVGVGAVVAEQTSDQPSVAAEPGTRPGPGAVPAGPEAQEAARVANLVGESYPAGVNQPLASLQPVNAAQGAHVATEALSLARQRASAAGRAGSDEQGVVR